jgi:DNA mismatch repair protein MutL
VIVDQHAAHEKIIYENLFFNLQAKAPQVQLLLVPFSWEVAASTSAEVQGNLDFLGKMGFLIEPFGGNSFLVKGYPRGLGEKFDLHSLLDGLTDVLGEPVGNLSGRPNFDHRLAAMAACKAAVKAGDPLDLKECQVLLEDLVKCEAPFTCPHGRPTLIRLPFVDLERRFRRN